MSSQDTLNYAEDEEERAKSIQSEIDKHQAAIHELQKDIDSKNSIIAGLQSQLSQHLRDSQRLRAQAQDEQQSEQEEQGRREQEQNQKNIGDRVKDAAKWGLFG